MPSTYTLKIEKKYFETKLIYNITVTTGQTTTVPKEDVKGSACQGGTGGDVDGDGKIGLEEVINALQVVSGVR